MSGHNAKIEKIWKDIVEATNKFVEDNPETTFYSMQSDSDNVENIANSLIFKGVWLFQRVDGDLKLRKKIRKVMGYSYP